MPELEFKVTGLAELHRALQAIPVRVEKNILRGMVRAAARPIVEDARQRAPVLKDDAPDRVPGALRKSVRAMSTVFKNGMVKGGVVAGSMKRTAKTAADAFYAFMVEYGTARAAAQPFLRPAVQAKTAAAIDTAAAYARERVEAGDLNR